MAPPIWHRSSLPARFNAKANVALFVLRQQEPFDPAFDVAFERVIAEPVDLGLVAHLVDHRGAEIVQTEHLDLKEDAPFQQRRRRIEVSHDDGGVGELVTRQRDTRAREIYVALRFPGDDCFRVVVVPPVLAGHVLFRRVEVQGRGAEPFEPGLEESLDQPRNRRHSAIGRLPPQRWVIAAAHHLPPLRRQLRVRMDDVCDLGTHEVAAFLMKSAQVLVCIASPIAKNPRRFSGVVERARLRI